MAYPRGPRGLYGAKPPFGTPISQRHPSTRGLVCSYLLNEGHGNAAYDSSGNGLHLFYDGAATNQINWQGGVPSIGGDNPRTFSPTPLLGGNPHRFTSPFNYPKISQFTEAVTIELWWWPETDTQANPVPVSHSVNVRFLFVKSGADMIWRVNGLGADVTDAGVFSPNPLRRWVHFIGTYDRINQTIYRDGLFRASVGKTAAIATSTGSWTIGDAVGSTNWTNGNIGLVRVWDRAMYADEVRELYDDPFGMYENPLHTGIAAPESLDGRITINTGLAGDLTNGIVLAGAIPINVQPQGALTNSIQMAAQIPVGASLAATLKTAKIAHKLKPCGHPMFTQCGHHLTD